MMKKLLTTIILLFAFYNISEAVQQCGSGNANPDVIPSNLRISSTTRGTPSYGDVWLDGKGILRMYNGAKNIDLNSDSFVTNINSVADIPNPLTDGYYIINADLTIGDGAEFVFDREQASIIIEGRAFIYYTGSGTLFSGADIGTAFIGIRDLTVIDVNGNGTLFDIYSSSDPGIPPVIYTNTFAATGWGRLGYFNGTSVSMSVSGFFNFGDGFYFESTPLNLLSSLTFLNSKNNSINHLNISGTIENFSLTGGVSEPGSNEYTFFIHSTSTVKTATVNGFSVDTSTGGSAFNGGLDQTALGWNYSGNVGIPDSTIVTHDFYAGLSSVTVVTNDNTPYPLVTTWTQHHQERFISFSTGSFVYTGVTTSRALGHLKLTLDPASGATSEWTTYIYQNGVEVPGSSSNIEVPVGGIIEFNSLGFIDVLTNGDELTIWVERNNGAGDVVSPVGLFIVTEQ